MAVFSKSGAAISSVYSKAGSSLPIAYDKSGDVVFSGNTTLKIMNYNVGQWYIGSNTNVPTAKKSAYYALQTGMFAAHRPDILLMQEYWTNWCADGSNSSELLSPYFTTKEVTNPQGYIGHAICTNGISLASYTSHQFSSNRGNYPTFESANITVGGKTITLVNTHNDYYAEYQTTEISELLAFLATLDSFILCGDFNINLATQDTTDAQYTINVKPFVDAGYHVGNCVMEWIPTYYGTASPTGGKFTDQIITSADITILDIYSDTTKLTDNIDDKIDHIPLIAIVEVSP